MSDADFVARLVRFGRTLRGAGLEVGPGRLQDAMTALGTVEVTVRDDVYWALRCTLCSHHDHLEPFDSAFDAFWRSQDPTVEIRRHEGNPSEDQAGGAPEEETATRTLALEASRDDAPPVGESEHGQGSSARERLMTLDFREYGDQELRQAGALVDRIARSLPRRRSSRLEPAPAGHALDMRRTLREAMRTEGDPVRRAWRRRRLVARPTVFLLDVSGSMAPYARAMVMFAQSAVQAGRGVEVFTFGTRLTRLTAQLAAPDRDHALAEAALAVPDWAGGTRIGASVHAFNDGWGRRGLARGAVVVVASDGWERGDAEPLGTAMAGLQRSAHAVVWVNPLAGDPRYRPLAAGMAAALPHVDVFLPGHDLAALVSLVDVLEALPDRRGRMRRRSSLQRPARTRP